MTSKMTGVIAPILTPFNHDLSFAPDLYVDHGHWLLARGIHYIAPFGTTGEALSMTVNERMVAVDVLIDGGIDPAALMLGAGLCNLEDTVTLCRHAVERGCAAVMTLPPFFYKNASDDGLYAYFARLIESVNHPDLKICMYHIPSMAGIGFGPELAGRLARDYADTVVAYKDSSGDFEHTRAIIAAAPDIAVFPGSETFLRLGLDHGGMGCISATCNINPCGIRRVYDMVTGAMHGELDQVNDQMIAIRKVMGGYAPIPAMKGLLAGMHGDERWRNLRPPLLPIGRAETARLIDALDSAGYGIPLTAP